MADVIHLFYSRENNCAHIFATCKLDSAVIISRTVIRTCPTCKKTHSFFNQATYMTATPSQERSFYLLAEKIGVVEFEIILEQ